MTVDPHKIKAVFLKAVEQCEPGQWAAFLETACEGDATITRSAKAYVVPAAYAA